MRKRIAVITARADDNEQKSIINGIAEAAFSLNVDVVVFTNIYNHWVNDEVLNFENVIFDFFNPLMFDGVIITAESFMNLKILDDVMEKIKKSCLPAVIIGGSADGFASIYTDDEADMGAITEHLVVEHGFTDIDILTGSKDNPLSHIRVSGCKRVFSKHGIPFNENKVHFGDFWTGSGEHLAMRYLNGELPMPEAVICTNDYMAYGLCDTLTAAGVKIPERVTVTGYDYNSDRIFHYPILTTYRRNRRQMGIDAVNTLFSSDYAVDEDSRFIYGNTCFCGTDSNHLSQEVRTVRIGQYHIVMNSAAQFASRLTLCRTLAEYMGVINEFSYLLHNATNLHLCIDKEWNSTSYAGESFLWCRTDKEPPEIFSKEVLLPSLTENRKGPMIFYFTPLCFQTRLFGYIVLAYDEPQCYDFSFRDWSKTAANALEFLRMKNDIHYLSKCQRASSLYDSLTGFYNLREFRQIAETIDGEGYMHAVKMTFPSNGEYIYGENYRNDIISAVADAIKLASGHKEISCYAAEDTFIVLCSINNKDVFAEKLKIMMHHKLGGKFTEQQINLSYGEYSGIINNDAIDNLILATKRDAEEAASKANDNKKLPHYNALVEMRSDMILSPKNALSIDEASRNICVSSGYFRSIYKRAFGVSYMQDCINSRIMLACYLLCSTAMSVYAVAMKCGYTDEKYFARQFRKNIGCSPIQYRNKIC